MGNSHKPNNGNGRNRYGRRSAAFRDRQEELRRGPDPDEALGELYGDLEVRRVEVLGTLGGVAGEGTNDHDPESKDGPTDAPQR